MPIDIVPYTYLAGYDKPVASVARWILKRIEDTYAGASVALPARRVLTVGTVAVEAEILAVMFGAFYTGTPGNELNTPQGRDSARSATFNIELWRHVPGLTEGGDIPSKATVDAAAEATMLDASVLLEAAFNCDAFGRGVIANVTVHEPQGEMHGVSMAMEIQVP